MQQYFKIGEISKLYNIGPDSLRYYEELGILSPKRGDNGYRLYSIRDLWRLNVIRDLRELGFPMDTIKEYLEDRSVETTRNLFKRELSAIEERITSLQELKEDVTARIATLDRAKVQTIGMVEQKTFHRRHCYMIHSGYETDPEMDVLIKQLINQDRENLYIIGNNRIGSVLSLEGIQQHKYRNYESVFIISSHGDHIIEGGTYLTINYRGEPDADGTYIRKLLEHAKKQNLTPAGPVLELLWVDIHQAEDIREHITELQLRCL